MTSQRMQVHGQCRRREQDDDEGQHRRQWCGSSGGQVPGRKSDGRRGGGNEGCQRRGWRRGERTIGSRVVEAGAGSRLTARTPRRPRPRASSQRPCAAEGLRQPAERRRRPARRLPARNAGCGGPVARSHGGTRLASRSPSCWYMRAGSSRRIASTRLVRQKKSFQEIDAIVRRFEIARPTHSVSSSAMSGMSSIAKGGRRDRSSRSNAANSTSRQPRRKNVGRAQSSAIVSGVRS